MSFQLGYLRLRKLPVGTGLVVNLIGTVPNPPFEVEIRGGGWVGFGAGQVTAEIGALVQARVIDGVTAHAATDGDVAGRQHASARRFARAFKAEAGELGVKEILGTREAGAAKEMAAELGISWRDYVLPLVTDMVPRPERHVAYDYADLSPAGLPGQVLLDEQGRMKSRLFVSPESLQFIREVQGLSLERTAALLTLLDPGTPVSKKQVESLRWESPLTRPPSELVSRLDMVLGLDGRLGIDRVLVANPEFADLESERHVEIRYPVYWRGVSCRV